MQLLVHFQNVHKIPTVTWSRFHTEVKGGVSRDSPSSDDQSKWPRGSPRAEYSSTLHGSTCVWCG